MKYLFLVFALAISFLAVTAGKPVKPFDEVYRPQFHFSPEKNWLANPCGLVFYKGEYHLFYQHNPFGNNNGHMHWGHAVSTNLVNWEFLPIALYPDNNSKDSINCTELPGSGIVDNNNVSRLQSGEEKTILLFYTSANCGQRLAYSNDKGRTWKKYDKNPIIPFDPADNAHNPKVFWHEQSKQYIMALFRQPENRASTRGISFYSSKDLINWTFKSHIAGFSDFSDVIELAVNQRDEDKKWLLFDGDGSYIIGSFDGDVFKPESPKLKSDFGGNYYSPQTWNNLPVSDGRTIQLAWMKDGEFTGMPFKGQMSFPCEIELKRTADGVRLIKKPVKEIEKMHLKGNVWENKNLIPGMDKNLIKGIKGDCFHIIGSFNIKNVDRFGFGLRLDKKNSGTEIVYDVQEKTLSFLGQVVKLDPVDGIIKLEILLDRSSVEVFANDGKIAMSSCFTPSDEALGTYLFNIGGELLVNKLEIYPMKSIWESVK